MYSFRFCIQNLLLLVTLALLFACNSRSGSPKVLVFSKTAGFHHASIPDGIAAIQKLGEENGFRVDTTTSGDAFTAENLSQYAAVIFLSTTGDVLNSYQETAFERYIQAGGGFVGIHAAADTEYEWGWYGRLVGGYFSDHPGIRDPHPNVQEGIFHVEDTTHPSTEFLPKEWVRTDEFYSYKDFNEDVNVLLTIDEDSYQGGLDMGVHPMAWYHEYDGGRAFYTAGGHTSESYSEELFMRHVLKGIEYAIGENKKLDYKKARTLPQPEENRFIKKILAIGEFYEPTEMTILPNFDILIAQRRGEILLYSQADSSVSQVASLDVYHHADVRGVNAEEGVLGLKADPDYAKNHWVYVYYSPIDTSVNRLSRFQYNDGNFDLSSEQIILELYSQRQICCHTGGSIAFDGNGLLYVSTGDNSTPFNQPNQKYKLNGFAPLDAQPGNKQYDARRSSGNANDLRGKILRIKVNEDGSYDIPEGNLYPEGTDGTRPEIYVQGNRNPYRISVDQKTGYLYWGEVGPDANDDSLDVKGPRGYDEVNQARKAGFFGWPLFIGNNYPYREFDYRSGKVGPAFDPERPVNNSPNNTGIKELPPAQPAFIWYPYDVSPDFPSVGTGGRNAMAGPVYYSDMYDSPNKLPEYYNGKLFIYDWVRGWVKVVTMKENGDFDKMEPFMEGTPFNALIDLEMGPDGRLYTLEYGNGWFTKNPDAALSRLDFIGGNRPPVIQDLTVDKSSGHLPFTVIANVVAFDPEKDEMTYEWDMGNGEIIKTDDPKVTYTYQEIGEFEISVEVLDESKSSIRSEPISVYAGNEAPQVAINLAGNKTFYFPDQKVEYTVSVTDKNNPAASDDTEGIFVSASYLESMDLAGADLGHQEFSESVMGKNLVQSLDCKTCHKEAEKSIGPPYVEVAVKYALQDDAMAYLSKKIIEGSAGVWGETAMPAHPNLSEAEARQLTSYILSLTDASPSSTLPFKGSLEPALGNPISDRGVLMISAAYTDQGNDEAKALTGRKTIVLRNSKLSMDGMSQLKEYNARSFNETPFLMVPDEAGSFAMEGIDLKDIQGLILTFIWQEAPTIPFEFSVRLDRPDGQEIGKATLMDDNLAISQGPISICPLDIEISEVDDGRLHDVFIVSQPSGTPEGFIAIRNLEFLSKKPIL